MGKQSNVSRMENYNLMPLTMVFLILLISGCHAKCLNVTTEFQTNLKTLRNLLTETAPSRDGFYQTSVGNNSDRVYGMVQCKANISSNACTACLKSLTSSMDRCQENTGNTETLASFCTLRFSIDNFFGEWSNTSTASYQSDRELDEPLVFSKGFSMMEGLAQTVADQPLMYQAGEVDVGDDGKRYGFVQCSRDLSKSNCRNCVEDRLVNYKSFVKNQTEWEILGTSCSLWYNNGSVVDTPDSTTASTPTQSQLPRENPSVTSGSRRYHGRLVVGITTSLNIGMLTLLVIDVLHLLS